MIALLVLAAMPVVSAQSTSLPPLGMSIGSIAGLKAAGAAPKYGSYWVGDWMATSGWGGFDSAMKTARAEGVTPVVYWYYWGDSIAPNCFDADGCNGRTEAQWDSLTDQLVAHLTSTLGGSEALVVLENEFNKGGITGDFAPSFDAKLEAVALKLKAVSGVKLIVGFGNWGEDSWAKFPKTIAASEYVGYQMMRASTRDTEASYRSAADRSAYLSSFIAEKFNKPSFLYDVALSSYPDAGWEKVQAETLGAIFAKLQSSGSTGLQGVVYRSLDDHYMSPANYYGLAESHWGLRAKDGTAKPAFGVWLSYAKGTISSPTPAAPPPVNLPGSFEAESMSATKGGAKNDASASGGKAWNLWSNGQLSTTLVTDTAQTHRITVQALGQSAGGIDARMEVRLGGATIATFDVAAGAYRAYRVDAAVPAGATTLAIAFTNDALVGSEDRNLIVDVATIGAVPPPSNSPPKADFDASVRDLTAELISRAFDADNDGLVLSWDLGDGQTASGEAVRHTYASGGSYLVSLTVSDGEASTTASKTVAVVRPNSAPVAAFAATATHLDASFDASGSSDVDGDALTYSWSFGDGATALGPTATHAYAAPGTYAATLTVSDGRESASATKTLAVSYPAPVAQATTSGAGDTRAFDGAGSHDPAGGALSYQWDFGDGASASGPTATHTFAPGTHTVTLTVTNKHGQSASATVSANVVRAPYAASFTPVNGNANWVQVRVHADQPAAAVCVALNGGACQPLQLKSWGDWAASMKVPANARVTYTATSAQGEKATSPAFAGSSSKLATAPFTATFTPHDGNNYWVQTKIGAGKPIASVCASVNGGACRALELKPWGSWAASFYVSTGARVVFIATSTSGEKAYSSGYAWPVK